MSKLLSGRHMLVVEDEMMVLIMIEDMLEELGCESVAVAATVKQALALIDTQTFDLAMLDVNLNGDKSFLVADSLGMRGIPFIFSTGYGVETLMADYLERPVIRKPFSYNRLEEVFTNLIQA